LCLGAVLFEVGFPALRKSRSCIGEWNLCVVAEFALCAAGCGCPGAR
jgi:hypothetical protein